MGNQPLSAAPDDYDDDLTYVRTGYSIDDDGRMLTRFLSTDSAASSFVWDGMNVVQETNPEGVVTLYNILQGALRSFSRSDVTYQVHTDALGSVRKVTDGSGSVVATKDTDAWGNPLPSSSDSVPDGGLAYGWVGALDVRYDSDTCLYYMRARWYDPTLQRFLSRDPMRVGAKCSKLQRSMACSNLYSYVDAHPTTAVDPNGDSLVWKGIPMPGGIVRRASPTSKDPGCVCQGLCAFSGDGWSLHHLLHNAPVIETGGSRTATEGDPFVETRPGLPHAGQRSVPG